MAPWLPRQRPGQQRNKRTLMGIPMRIKHTARVFTAILVFLQGTAFAATLITPQEAALPAAPGEALTRGISRGLSGAPVSRELG